MATDIARMMENLGHFYDLRGKVVLAVGAGGGQLIDAYQTAHKVVAIDQSEEALCQLERVASAKGMRERIELVLGDFIEASPVGDVAFFEFSLHEMADPFQALVHARNLALDVVVLDHLPVSEWAFYVVEEEKVRASTAAMERAGIRRRAAFSSEQRFQDYAELHAKVMRQGPTATERIARFRDQANIVIPMDYGLTLL